MNIVELNGVTELDQFIEKEDSNRLFQEILSQITWIQCEWNTPCCSASYVYTDREKDLTTKSSLEDISTIVETILETKVHKMWIWCYGNGEDHMCYRNLCSGHNLLHIFIGTKRKLFIKGSDDSQVFRMKHGDALYVPSDLNDARIQYSVPENHNISSCTLHLCFVIETPYSFRYRNTGRVHMLGKGPIDVTYDTRFYPDGLPENITITMLPSACIPPDANIGSIQPFGRQEFRFFPGITFTPVSLQDLYSHLQPSLPET